MQEVKDAVKVTFRLVAAVLGLIGTVFALVTNIVYSTGARTFFFIQTGTNGTTSHGWWGLLAVFAMLVGTLVVFFRPVFGALVLIASAIAFYFVVGPFAIIAGVIVVVGALIAFFDRGRLRTSK